MAKSRSRSRARSLVPHEVTITTPEDPEFDKVKELLERSSNIIAVTGAGMSTSCGIPAFRGSSPNCIYNKYGKYAFDYVQVHGNDREIATRYLEMVGDLRLMLDDCSPSPTHYFLKKLADGGRLRRVYTQNIDDLETRAGLELVTSLEDAEPKDGYRKVVQLHGHMRQLFCGICFHKTRFRREHAQIFQSQKRDIACPACNKSNLKRQGKMRARSVGKLQTCIVLQNGGPHPDCTSSILTIKPRRANAKAAQLIGQLFDLDTRSDPDLLLIIGTSLEIKDIKSFVTRLNRNMNVKTVIMDLNWIDFPGCEKVAYHLKGPCDFFVNALFPSLDLGTKDHVSGDNIAANNQRNSSSSSSYTIPKKKPPEQADTIGHFEPLPMRRTASIDSDVGEEDDAESDEDTPLSVPIPKRQRLSSRSTERTLNNSQPASRKTVLSSKAFVFSGEALRFDSSDDETWFSSLAGTDLSSTFFESNYLSHIQFRDVDIRDSLSYKGKSVGRNPDVDEAGKSKLFLSQSLASKLRASLSGLNSSYIFSCAKEETRTPTPQETETLNLNFNFLLQNRTPTFSSDFLKTFHARISSDVAHFGEPLILRHIASMFNTHRKRIYKSICKQSAFLHVILKRTLSNHIRVSVSFTDRQFQKQYCPLFYVPDPGFASLHEVSDIINKKLDAYFILSKCKSVSWESAPLEILAKNILPNALAFPTLGCLLNDLKALIGNRLESFRIPDALIGPTEELQVAKPARLFVAATEDMLRKGTDAGLSSALEEFRSSCHALVVHASVKELMLGHYTMATETTERFQNVIEPIQRVQGILYRDQRSAQVSGEESIFLKEFLERDWLAKGFCHIEPTPSEPCVPKRSASEVLPTLDEELSQFSSFESTLANDKSFWIEHSMTLPRLSLLARHILGMDFGVSPPDILDAPAPPNTLDVTQIACLREWITFS